MTELRKSTNTSENTLIYRRGQELGEAAKVWIEIAESEARTNLMGVLIREGIAFADLEEFQTGIRNKFKSSIMKTKISPFKPEINW